ncbi:hypothetical protein HX799_07420 [Pseudomonas tolaasii]|uniref:hypothetical protein n=1 Tax=Pseudomonas tolaasii TaxID=29442 RepID=UPI00159FBDDA|nr:hypothetical protein [Pseudomonas tolaasii]NWC30644.1 hypothetical protein [Pseudomonas tolaasii]NWC50989.1 hypothetical protein [Pseudomonas tolaasii]NWE62585.1 hypothetical protein [Pseudomonas tolaasii]
MSWESISFWIEHHPGLASWVQAVGSIAAILFAVFVAGRDSRLRRRSEAEAKTQALARAYTSVDDAFRRAASAFATADEMSLDRATMASINNDLNRAQQHLKEVISSPGVDSKIYSELFVVRTSVEDLAHALNAFSQATEHVPEFLESARKAINRIASSREKLGRISAASS